MAPIDYSTQSLYRFFFPPGGCLYNRPETRGQEILCQGESVWRVGCGVSIKNGASVAQLVEAIWRWQKIEADGDDFAELCRDV